MNMNTSLRVAMVMLLGTTMQGAVAYSPTNPVKIASETGSFDTIGAFNVDIPVIASREIVPDTTTPALSSQPYYVVITLTGGAQFKTITGLALNCGYIAATTIPAATDAPAAVAGGSVAGFRLSSGSLTANVVPCSLSIPALTLTSGVKDYGIKVEARHFDTYTPASATVSGTLISFVQGMQASVTPGSVTVDVSSPSLSKKFVVTGSVTGHSTTTTAVALLGVIRYEPVAGVVTPAMAAPTAGTYLNTFTLIVSGEPLAAVQQTAASGVASAGVFLSNSASSCETSGAGSLRVASGTQVSFTGVAATATVCVCMIGNDTSTINRGVVGFTISSVKAETTTYTNATPNLDMVDTTLVEVVKNGTSLKVLNIPAPDSPYDSPAIRFYNMGTTTGRITGTLYGQGDTNNVGGGEVLGAPNTILVESLAPNTVKLIPSAEIGKLFGKTTWAGRAWLQIESEIKGLRVQALIRTNVGGQAVLTNMSDRVMLDGETYQRTE
jgi:hypothetical protein